MNKREREQFNLMEYTLIELGFTPEEVNKLHRISMTLRRWYELECGDGNEYGSWAIEREDNGDGAPYMVRHHYRHGQGKDTVSRYRVPDREKGAIKRLQSIIGQRNGRPCMRDGALHATDGKKLSYYLQTDPRGAALYILRPGDVPAGEDAHAYYTRGICVW